MLPNIEGKHTLLHRMKRWLLQEQARVLRGARNFSCVLIIVLPGILCTFITEMTLLVSHTRTHPCSTHHLPLPWSLAPPMLPASWYCITRSPVFMPITEKCRTMQCTLKHTVTDSKRSSILQQDKLSTQRHKNR